MEAKEDTVVKPTVFKQQQNQSDGSQEQHENATDQEEIHEESAETDHESLSEGEGVEDPATFYQYRDFGGVLAESIHDPRLPSLTSPGMFTLPMPTFHQFNPNLGPNVATPRKLPQKLYAILSTSAFSHIIAWMPHGRSWKVLRRDLLETVIMPIYFDYAKCQSFYRLVNAWGFRSVKNDRDIKDNPDRGSYFHELFLRGRPHLLNSMRRSLKTHKKLKVRKSDEPDFHALDRHNPLPRPLESQMLANHTLIAHGMPPRIYYPYAHVPMSVSAPTLRQSHLPIMPAPVTAQPSDANQEEQTLFYGRIAVAGSANPTSRKCGLVYGGARARKPNPRLRVQGASTETITTPQAARLPPKTTRKSVPIAPP